PGFRSSRLLERRSQHPKNVPKPTSGLAQCGPCAAPESIAVVALAATRRGHTGAVVGAHRPQSAGLAPHGRPRVRHALGQTGAPERRDLAMGDFAWESVGLIGVSPLIMFLGVSLAREQYARARGRWPLARATCLAGVVATQTSGAGLFCFGVAGVTY